MRVELGVLGEVRALVDGEPVDLGPARQRCVLAILLVDANRPIPLEQLIDRLWGDAAPQRATGTLHSYLSRLRAALPPAANIRRSSGGYLLEVDEAAVDLHRFRALSSQARAGDDDAAAALYERALRQWRGEPFADLDSPWLAGVRHVLRSEWLAARLDHHDAELRHGRHRALLSDLAVLAEEHPLDERVAGQLMLALYRSGRQADALAHYDRTRRRLAAELGIDPGPDLQQLHRQLLNSDPALTLSPAVSPRTAQAPRQLPAPPPVFTGRARELADLDRTMERAGTVVISTIGGMGGVGKTWLALHWAHRNLHRFPDGQLYVNLRGFDPSGVPTPPETAVRGFLDALAADPAAIPTDLEGQAALYRSLVADRRMLILLDNAHDTAQVTPLLPGSPSCTVLVTSRHRLPGLVTTHGARPVAVDMLDDAEARQLLTYHLGRERILAEPQAVTDLLDRCAGLPLALAIVAARVMTQPNLPLAALARELRAPLHALDAGEPTADLSGVFSWSYRSLSPETARLFRLLGVHPGPDLTLEAAASLTGLRPPQVRPLLAELLRAHLVTEHTPGRYTLHDLLRAYAAEQVRVDDTPAEGAAALDRVLDHYLHTAHAAAHRLRPYSDPIPLPDPCPGATPADVSDERQARAWFTAEHANLLAAVRHAAGAGLTTYVWRLAWALVHVLDQRGHWQDLYAVQDLALRAAAGDTLGQAHSHAGLATACIRLGRHDDALAHLHAALELFAALDDRVGQARMHHDLGWAQGMAGRNQEAHDHLRRSLALYEAEGHRRGTSTALSDLGWCNALMGNYRETIIHCEQALRLNQEIGHVHGQTVDLDSLGYAHHHLGDHARAISCYEEGLRLAREIDAPYVRAQLLDHLGDTHHAAGDTEAARHCWEQALDILEQLGHSDAQQVRGKLDRGRPVNRLV